MMTTSGTVMCPLSSIVALSEGISDFDSPVSPRFFALRSTMNIMAR